MLMLYASPLARTTQGQLRWALHESIIPLLDGVGLGWCQTLHWAALPTSHTSVRRLGLPHGTLAIT